MSIFQGESVMTRNFVKVATIVVLFGIGLVGGRAAHAFLFKPRLDLPPAVAVSGEGPRRGNGKAPVTIVVFSDFQCRMSHFMSQTLEKIRQQYPEEVAIVFRHFPKPYHAQARPAAELAAAAWKQNQFWTVHDLLMNNQNLVQKGEPRTLLVGKGLDLEQLDRDLQSGAARAIVDADIALAGTLKIRGVPTLFVNGRQLVGNAPASRVEGLILAELKAHRAAALR
jgi:protein-disulfide isomerase